MTFWIISSALALVVAALFALVLLRTRQGGEPAAAFDLRVYRDQLSDVDRDLARGVVAQADAERIKTEVSRRILAADAQARATAAPGTGQAHGLSVALAVVVAVAVTGGSLLLYRSLGAPGYGDLGLERRIEIAETARATRPGQSEAEASLPPQPPLEGLSAEYVTLIDRLRATVAERPDDIQGLTLLARNEAAIGNFHAAHVAQARVLDLKGDAANSAEYADYADMQILAAGGYVSPEAEAALRTALEQDPRNGPARYYWGLMMGQTGRPDIAFRVWNTLLVEGPPDAPWIFPIRAQIGEMATRAGVEFDLPPAAPTPPGPSAGDVNAAADMTDDERREMIQGMVQRLSDRLATEGGTPPEWARLIGALAVLGDTDQAKAIYDNAQEVFAGDDAALAAIQAGAQRAGLIP